MSRLPGNHTSFLAIALAGSLLWVACISPAPSVPTATPEMQATATAAVTPTATPTPEPATVEVVPDVPYLVPLQDSVKERMLDIYVPSVAEAPTGHYPVVVFAHGYNQGKDALGTVCRQLAGQGMLVFAPNWPTDPSSAASWREMTEALTCAVRSARTAAPGYNGDPDNITLVGFSMGGSVGAIVALNDPDLESAWDVYTAGHDGPPAQARCVDADASTRVQAFVGIGGAYSLPERFEADDPDLYALLTAFGTTTDLRIALLHGEFDTTVPPAISEAFETELTAAGFAPTLTSFDSGHTIPRDLTVATIVDIAR